MREKDEKEGIVQKISELSELNREEKMSLIVVTHALDLAGRMERVYSITNGNLQQ